MIVKITSDGHYSEVTSLSEELERAIVFNDASIINICNIENLKTALNLCKFEEERRILQKQAAERLCLTIESPPSCEVKEQKSSSLDDFFNFSVDSKKLFSDILSQLEVPKNNPDPIEKINSELAEEADKIMDKPCEPAKKCKCKRKKKDAQITSNNSARADDSSDGLNDNLAILGSVVGESLSCIGQAIGNTFTALGEIISDISSNFPDAD